MEPAELQQILDHLLTHWESETVEFKEAGNDYPTDRIGRYFSALANEANLEGAESAWLVFGVNDKTRDVVGTDYREEAERLQSLKQQVAQDAEPRISFRGIHELRAPQGRVILLEIPASPQGIPFHGRVTTTAGTARAWVPSASTRSTGFASRPRDRTGAHR